MTRTLLSFFVFLVCFLLFKAVAAGSDAADECTRPCHDDDIPRKCRYRWMLENYLTLSRACYSCPGNQTDCLRPQCVTGDGIRRSIRTANRMMPGPGIQVCEGDTVEVEVINAMVMGEGMTIHWHGLHQRHSPHMDGVAMVTQCPIPASSSFTYRFVADNPGTHFWHAHSGLQLADGLFGPLVIRQSPSRDPHSSHYDIDQPDHVIILNDWSSETIVETYTDFYHVHGSKRPRSILINGRGRLFDSKGNPTTDTPLAEFKVEQGKKYRFRVVGAGMLKCPLRLSIDDHEPLVVIASDGRPIEPYLLNHLDVYSGERYDFILNADGGKGGAEDVPEAFSVRVRGLIDCDPGHLQQLAVLRYNANGRRNGGGDVKDQDTVLSEAKFLGTSNSAHRLKATEISEMTSMEPDDESLMSEPDVRLYLELKVRGVNNPHFFNPTLYPEGGRGYPPMFTPQINGISNRLPFAPMLSQMDDLDPGMFCNSSSTSRSCYHGNHFCECIHRLSVAMGDVVEMVIVSSSSAHTFSHPMHVHGHSFRVVAMDRLHDDMTVDLFKRLDSRGEVKRRLHRAPYKDSLAVPDGGYAVVRLVSHNPGVWFVHCHLAFHVEVGMSLFLHVPNSQGRMPAPPPGFPRCGPWTPELPQQPSVNHSPSHPQPSTKLATSSSWVDTETGSVFASKYTTARKVGRYDVNPAFKSSSPLTRESSGLTDEVVHSLTPTWVAPLVITLCSVILVLIIMLMFLRSSSTEQSRLKASCSSYSEVGFTNRQETDSLLPTTVS